jgi:outer membrane protein TolC
MKNCIKSLLPITIFLFLTVMPVQAEEYDLAAYLAKVEQNNPDLTLALKELELTRTSVSQARSAFFPNIGVQGGYTRNLTDAMRSTPAASARRPACLSRC